MKKLKKNISAADVIKLQLAAKRIARRGDLTLARRMANTARVLWQELKRQQAMAQDNDSSTPTDHQD